MDTLSLILEKKIVVVIRGIYGDNLLFLADSLMKGGCDILEVAFEQNLPDCEDKTAGAIASLRRIGVCAGAGTVLTKEQVRCACESGASFIISPNTESKVIKYTKKYGLVSVPGASTPTEILNAHNLGADIVKLFPATSLGLNFVKDILKPLSHIKVMATGGINDKNFTEFMTAGCCGAGISSFLTDKKLVSERDCDELTRRAKLMCGLASVC